MADSGWLVGHHAVAAALAGGRAADVLWLLEGRHDRRARELIAEARRRGLPVKLVPRARLDEVAGGVPHNGCALRAAPVAWRQLDDLVAPAGAPGRLLLVDTVVDPRNLGAVIRTAAAFALDGLVVAGPSAPPLSGAVATAAAGHLERVPLVRATVAADVLHRLRDAGYWAWGAASSGRSAAGFDPGERWVLCIGGEARGVRAKTRSEVDGWIGVPMAPGVESLNLAVACGVLLWELCGRGGDEGGPG